MSAARSGFPLIALGTVFLALGATGQRAFLALGLAFLAIGAVLLVRARREG